MICSLGKLVPPLIFSALATIALTLYAIYAQKIVNSLYGYYEKNCSPKQMYVIKMLCLFIPPTIYGQLLRAFGVLMALTFFVLCVREIYILLSRASVC